MPDSPRPILIRSSSGLQPFSTGRLVGDLVIRYTMPPERAMAVARDLHEVFEIVRATRSIRVLGTDDVRRGVDGLLEGRSRAELAAELAPSMAARPRQEPRFATPPTGPEIARLQDAAAAYGLHMLACAGRGEGDPELIEAMSLLFAEIERRANEGFDGPQEMKAAFAAHAVASAQKQIAAHYDPRAEKTYKLTIGDVIRWLIDFLKISDIPTLIGSDDGDDPRDTPGPTIFGEELSDGWQLDESLEGWRAISKTGSSADNMRICSAFSYRDQAGKSQPKTDDFDDDGESHPGNHHELGRVALPPLLPGNYFATHLLSEDDATDEETARSAADVIVTILGKIASGVMAKGIDVGGAAVGLPGAGAIVDIVAGPAIDKANEIVGGKLRELLAQWFGPELFHPVFVRVEVDWVNSEPQWRVWVQGHYMGMRTGVGDILTQRHPNGMPYTVQHNGPGRYTYQFRFRVRAG